MKKNENNVEQYILMVLEQLMNLHQEQIKEMNIFKEKIADRIEVMAKLNQDIIARMTIVESIYRQYSLPATLKTNTENRERITTLIKNVDTLTQGLDSMEEKIINIKDSLIKRLLWGSIGAALFTGIIKLIELIVQYKIFF